MSSVSGRSRSRYSSSRFMPNINDSLRNIISGFVDLTGRIFVAGFKQGQSIVHRRYITYNNQETMEAKDRFGTLARCGPILIEPEAQCWTKIEDNLSKKGT